jgi:hypothetical protein
LSIAKSVSSVERRRMGFFPGGMVVDQIFCEIGLFGKERNSRGGVPSSVFKNKKTLKSFLTIYDVGISIFILFIK